MTSRPNNSNTNRRTIRRTPTTEGRSSAERYRSTRTPRTTETRPGSDRRAPRDVGARTGRPTRGDATPPTRRAGDVRTGRVGGRYAPRDRVPTRSTTRVRDRSPSRGARETGADLPRVGRRTLATPRVRSDVGPRLVPRTAAPRLGGFRPVNARVGRVSPALRNYLGYSYRWGAGNGWCSPVWNGYWGWNNWGWGAGWGGGFGHGWWRPWRSCWSLGFGLNSWGFCGVRPLWGTFGALAPYYAWQLSYWDSCYNSCYWNSWAVPNALPSNYWWYPTDTYCPIYLTVPGSVVVVDDSAGGSVGGGAGEVIVAGGSVVDRARSEEPADESAAAGESAATALARKYVELGDYYFRLGRYEEAAESYAKARNNAPDDASVHFVLADAVFANGDYHYAAFLIAEGVRLEPAIVTADVDKRAVYGDPREFENQLQALRRYCDEKPYDAWAWLVLAYNLRFSGESAAAIPVFKKVLELDRENPTARAFLAELEAPPAEAAAAPAGDDGGR